MDTLEQRLIDLDVSTLHAISSNGDLTSISLSWQRILADILSVKSDPAFERVLQLASAVASRVDCFARAVLDVQKEKDDHIAQLDKDLRALGISASADNAQHRPSGVTPEGRGRRPQRRDRSRTARTESHVLPTRPQMATSVTQTALRIWFSQHLSFPYPTIEEKEALATAAKIPRTKVDSDLTNWRRRSGWTALCDEIGDGDRLATQKIIERVLAGREENAAVRQEVLRIKRYLVGDGEEAGDWVKSGKVANAQLPGGDALPPLSTVTLDITDATGGIELDTSDSESEADDDDKVPPPPPKKAARRASAPAKRGRAREKSDEDADEVDEGLDVGPSGGAKGKKGKAAKKAKVEPKGKSKGKAKGVVKVKEECVDEEDDAPAASASTPTPTHPSAQRNVSTSSNTSNITDISAVSRSLDPSPFTSPAMHAPAPPPGQFFFEHRYAGPHGLAPMQVVGAYGPNGNKRLASDTFEMPFSKVARTVSGSSGFSMGSDGYASASGHGGYASSGSESASGYVTAQTSASIPGSYPFHPSFPPHTPARPAHAHADSRSVSPSNSTTTTRSSSSGSDIEHVENAYLFPPGFGMPGMQGWEMVASVAQPPQMAQHPIPPPPAHRQANPALEHALQQGIFQFGAAMMSGEAGQAGEGEQGGWVFAPDLRRQ